MTTPSRQLAASPPIDHDLVVDAASRWPAELHRRREWLHAVRWRRVGPPPHWGLILLAIFVLHLALMLALREAMRPLPYIPLDDMMPIEVGLIELPPLPEPVARKPDAIRLAIDQNGHAANAPAPPRPALAARKAMPAALNTQGGDTLVETPILTKLFNPDGSLRLPESQRRKDQFNFDISAGLEMRKRGHNVIRCQPSNFSGTYSPYESAGAEFARKYLGFIGLYNPHTAEKTSKRVADAKAACDDAGH